MSVIFHNYPPFTINDAHTIGEAEAIINSNSFDRFLCSLHYNEAQYERIILGSLRSLFSLTCYIFNYKIRIVNNITGSSMVPDLMAVRKDLKEWYIIEVELENHPHEHMIRQLNTFINHDRNSILGSLTYIIKKIKEINPFFAQETELEELINLKDPEVVLMAEHISPILRYKLIKDKNDCNFATFQLYSNEEGRQLFRLNDMKIFSSLHGKTWVEIDYANSLIITSSFLLYFKDYRDGDKVSIQINNAFTEWTIQSRKNGKVRLAHANIGFPISSLTNKALLLHRDENLYLKTI